MKLQKLRLNSYYHGSKSILIVFFLSILLTNCKKERGLTSDTQQASISILSTKVNSWLEKNKATGINATSSTSKNDNIELLKQNLNFKAAKTVPRDNNYDLLIVPVTEELKIKKNLEKNSTLTLLLVTDKIGNIKWGNVVYFLPEDGVKRDTLSSSTLQNIFNGKPVHDNGMFKFLSITGRRMYELGFKNNKLYSYGILKSKSDSTQRTTGCNAWFLVSTYINPDGSSYETWTFLGITCDGVCGDPNYQSLCPDGGGGGGGGGGENDQITTEGNVLEDEAVYSDQDNSYLADNTAYVPIKYLYHYTITRVAQTGEIVTINVDPVAVDPVQAVYIDNYGRNVTRYLTLQGQYKNFSLLSPTNAMINWSCYVTGRYTYTNGNPAWTRQWQKSKSIII